MPHKSAGFTVLLVCALLAGTARADDAHKPPPPQDPDPGFLEFLGSVDGLADVNPDYLAQAKVARPPPAAPAAAAVKPPPATPAPPPPASAAGVKNNE
jgi:hypothetical protein